MVLYEVIEWIPNTRNSDIINYSVNKTLINPLIFKYCNKNAYNSKKLYTRPINPLTSTNEKPINAHLINVLLINGLREIENTRKANIIPIMKVI